MIFSRVETKSYSTFCKFATVKKCAVIVLMLFLCSGVFAGTGSSSAHFINAGNSSNTIKKGNATELQDDEIDAFEMDIATAGASSFSKTNSGYPISGSLHPDKIKTSDILCFQISTTRHITYELFGNHSLFHNYHTHTLW